LRFEVLTALKLSNVVFWVFMACSLEGGYEYFGGTLITTYSMPMDLKPLKICEL
jgi:hypothetical protein